MAGRVEESDLRELVLALGMREGNGVGANVLRDTTGFARGDIGLANDIQKRRLAMVNVPHDGHDWSAWLQILEFVLDIEFNLFDGGMNHATAALAFLNFKTETVQCADLFGGRFINRLVDGRKNAHFH